MKASELRVGNFVSNPPLSDFRIIDHLDIRDHTENRLIMPFEPIPLTEEWLLRFGFCKSDEWFTDDNITIGWITNDEFYQLELGTQFCIDLKTVHQLQNLYFALTGNELTLK